jgi:sulfotransferase family protein
MALPTFVGIGPGRSGTSWLYEMLDAHPGVAMARGTKETEYFNREFHRGRDWYERFFDGSVAVRGEISQRYVFDPEVAARMAALVPDAKILVTLRAPLERMLSVYRYKRRAGLWSKPFPDMLREDSSLVDENRYDRLLEPFFAAYPRTQILLCLYDDLQRSASAYLGEVLSFIGAPDARLPAGVDSVVNPAAAARSPALASASHFAATALRRAGLYGVLRRAKRSGFLRSLVLREAAQGDASDDRVPDSLRDSLVAALRPGVEWTERETGRKLGHWLEFGQG